MELSQDLIQKQELEIEKVPQEELAEREPGVPAYKEKLEYDEEQIERLRDEIFKGLDRMIEERTNEKLESKWDECEAQYKGQLAGDTSLEYALNVPITQVKVDSITRLAVKAFLESDPKFSITPRPEMAKTDKWDVTVNRQSDYLDYELDERIKIDSPLRKVIHQACLYDVGIMKMPYAFERSQRRREEFYSAKPQLKQTQQGNILIPEGLESFLSQYPEAVEPGNEGHWVVKQLMAGKDVTFKAEYLEVTYDDPKPAFVDIRDFYVSKDVEGYEGLCKTQLVIERQKYTWFELKQAEANGDFDNVDDCKTIQNDDTKKGQTEPDSYDEGNYRTRTYYVLECIYHFNEKDSDNPDDITKIVCYFEEKSKAYLGAIVYPCDAVESYYIPFYVKDKIPGFYKGGVAEDLRDSHLAQCSILNLMLTEAWMQMTTTPIVRQGSPIVDQFMNKRWKPGVPIEIPIGSMSLDSELGFLDKPNRAVAQQLLPILQHLSKLDDDRTGVSSYMTGKESPTDPSAPAAKTAMLLEQSGINISDYINCLLPSFNKIGEIILQLTYQMSKKGRKIATRVTGGDPFEMISRDEMVAKTNIQSRAAGFAFDKVNEKRENLALFQLMFPILAQSQLGTPEGVYTLAKTLIQSWSPLWKNKVDQLLPEPQQFQQEQFKVCLQALGLYMEQMKAKRELTGVEQQPNFVEFVGLATQMMKQAVSPMVDESKTNE